MTATMKKLGVVAVLFALVASIGLAQRRQTRSRSFSRLSTIRKSRR